MFLLNHYFFFSDQSAPPTNVKKTIKASAERYNGWAHVNTAVDFHTFVGSWVGLCEFIFPEVIASSVSESGMAE